MAFESLQKRLLTLQETTNQIQILITRLATIKFPTDTTKSEAEQDVTELNDEIAQSLREQAEDLELLDQEVKDMPDGRKGSDTEAVKQRLHERCIRAAQDLKNARTEYSKAQRTAIRTWRLMERAARELHLQSLINPPKQDDPNGSQPISRRRTPAPEQSQDEKLVGAAGDVTEALRRTHALLSNELSRSQFAHDTLKESSAALGQLSENYSSLDSVLNSTKTLLGTLMRSQKSDTWYLETAFYILVATIGWLIFRRFIYGPAWWFIYLPLKLVWNAWMGVFTVLGLRGGGSAVSSVVQSQSMAATIIPSATTVQVTVSGTDSPRVGMAGRAGRGHLRPPSDDTEPGSVSENVGRMVEESREQAQGGPAEEQPQQEQVQREEQRQEQHQEEQIQRNPKKRVWDEAVEAPKHEAEQQKHKDEL